MTFEEALAAIAALESRGWKLGLERMEEFVRLLGLERAVRERKYVHVAGTNGKGSTTAYVQSILTASGVKTGAFYSPYVIDSRERVQIDGALIPHDEFAALTEHLMALAKPLETSDHGGISEFEFKTGLGFYYWDRHDCPWIALETGLGGRLDSTNVVTPAVSIIVSIGLDHQNILGDTIEKIAWEKAGIIKPGRPVVVGDMPREAKHVIVDRAKELGCENWSFGEEIQLDGDCLVTPRGRFGRLEPSMQGVWQKHNLALAIAGLQLAEAPITLEGLAKGMRSAWLPGRLQVIERDGKHFVLDGAHNIDSALALNKTLEEKYGDQKFTLMTNMVDGHELAPFYEPLRGRVRKVIVAPISSPRARPVSETAKNLKELGFETEEAHSIPEAVELAGGTDPILVTGSFYLVGDVGRYLSL